MADDNSQDYVIKTDAQTFRIRADKDMPQEQVLSLAAATNPEFAQYHAQAQAQAQFKNLPKTPITMSSGGIGGMGTTQMVSPEEAQAYSQESGRDLVTTAGLVAGGASSGMGALARIGATGTAVGATSLATGSSPEQAMEDVRNQAILPEVGGKVVEGAAGLAGKGATKLIQNLIKPSEKMFRYGKDPVEAVLNLPGTPMSKEELLKNVVTELDKTGRDISAKIANAQATLPVGRGIVPIQRLVNDPIDREIAKVTADRGMTMSEKKGVLTALEDFRDGLMKDVNTGQPKRSMVNLGELQKMKQEIGKATDWRPPTDTIQAKVQPIINGLRKEIYDGMRQSIEARVPGIDTDNQKWGSLLDAQKSIEKKMNTGPIMDLKDLLVLTKSPGLGLAKVAMKTTPGAVSSAKALRSMSKTGGAGVSQLLRLIAGMIESSGSGTGESQQSPSQEQ